MTGTDPSRPVPPSPKPPPPGMRIAAGLLAVVVLSLLFGLWGAWQAFAPGSGNPHGEIAGQAATIEALQQQVATLARSDQISREANRELQGTLAERDEEIAALRADVAFYERFVGSTAQRGGLTVHELRLQPRTGQGWHYTATLTQSLSRDAASTGEMQLTIEGTREGRLEALDWSDLRQSVGAAGVPFSFKYFQQVDGDIVLPTGFEPLRVTVRLTPTRGGPVEQAFSWTDVAPAPAP